MATTSTSSTSTDTLRAVAPMACVRGLTSRRDDVERELALQGIELPLPQCAEWQRAHGASDGLLWIARDGDNAYRSAVAAAVFHSRAIPGHRIYRVERLGTAAARDVRVLAEFAQSARRDPLCLRAVVDVCDRDDGVRQTLGESLAGLGFVHAASPRMYEWTLGIDLEGTEDQVFARLHSTARKNVRGPAKKGLVTRVVTDPRFAERIDSLMQRVYHRTRGEFTQQPWARIIAMSTRYPSRSRVAGLFEPAVDGPDGLVAAAWACVHGTYATYEAGAALRDQRFGSTPLSYAPLWDLIAWARAETTARWFDLGGVSVDTTDESLQGIARFKRYFSEQLLRVGDEWTLEPHRTRATIARAITGAARWAGLVDAPVR